MEARRESLRKSEGLDQSIDCLSMNIKKSNMPSLSKPNLNKMYIHYHEYIEFLYGFSGKANVHIGNNTYTMEEGDLLIINAGEMHTVTCTEGEASYYVIKFLPKLLYAQGQSLSVVRHLLPMWQKQVAFHPALRKSDLEGSGIHEQVMGIKSEWENRSAGYELIIHANIMRMFVWMLRHCCSGITQTADVPIHLQRSLQVALEETPKNLDTWNAEEAAKACGLSYNYFCHNFKRAFGFSYTSYLESLRLREGERLLLTTDMDITDIAFAVGFGTVSYFIERFKSNYGITPRVFRERLKG